VSLAGKLALALSAVVAGVVVGVLVLGANDDDGGPRLARRTIAITTSITPRVHLFADPIVAHVDLLFDRRRVNPDGIVVDAAFRPYEQVGAPTVERSEVGNAVRLRYSYPLQCLARACAPTAPRREVRWPPVRVTYTLVDARARANDVAVWPPVDMASRLGPFDIQEARWRAELSPPDVTYRISPGLLAAGLGGSSLVLVLGAGLLAARLLRRRPEEAAATAPAEAAHPLTRALESVLLVSSNASPPKRRQALERLARQLDLEGEPGLAERARRIAWSPAEPARGEIEELAGDVREAVPVEDDDRAP
jgi:hypothetical protein